MLWFGGSRRPDGTLSCFHAQCAAAPKTKFRFLKKLKLTKGAEPEPLTRILLKFGKKLDKRGDCKHFQT